jgi:hypothetical protein
VCLALAAGNITFAARANGVMKAAFLGGRPVNKNSCHCCPGLFGGIRLSDPAIPALRRRHLSGISLLVCSGARGHRFRHLPELSDRNLRRPRAGVANLSEHHLEIPMQSDPVHRKCLYRSLLRFMGELAAGLHAEGLTIQLGGPVRTDTRATFGIPQDLLDKLFTGEDWLIPKRNIKFHRMLLTIQR